MDTRMGAGDLSLRAVLVVAFSSVWADEEAIYKPGAEYRLYSETWSEELDLSALKPVGSGTINAGTGSESSKPVAADDVPDLDVLTPGETQTVNAVEGNDSSEPAASSDSFVVVNDLIKCEKAGQYQFQPGEPGEKAYQFKGHAKFVDIARLSGWKVLGDFWRSWVVDFEEGKPRSKHGMGIERFNLRLCEVSGFDLRPLLHFWGTPPPHVVVLRTSQAELNETAKAARAKAEQAIRDLDAAKLKA